MKFLFLFLKINLVFILIKVTIYDIWKLILISDNDLDMFYN